MTAITLYHNPDCSKSRAALALLEENDAQITIVYYLEEPLERSELENLLDQLGLSLRDLLRKSESRVRTICPRRRNAQRRHRVRTGSQEPHSNSATHSGSR